MRAGVEGRSGALVTKQDGATLEQAARGPGHHQRARRAWHAQPLSKRTGVARTCNPPRRRRATLAAVGGDKGGQMGQSVKKKNGPASPQPARGGRAILPGPVRAKCWAGSLQCAPARVRPCESETRRTGRQSCRRTIASGANKGAAGADPGFISGRL